MSSEYAIRVENLSKCYNIYEKPRDRLLQMLARGHKQYYREFWALRDVSFEVKKGETIGIVGRNGSGKSTLLQMICGTLNPTSGRIQINGRIAALLELGSGFNPEFTGRENIYMNTAVLGLSKEETDARFDDIVAFADIGDFIEQPVKTYSSGMYVRLAFAVAVNVFPDILIVDEVLAVGDVRFQVKCQRKFDEFRDSGKTIIIVSHSSNDVVRLCSRAIWLMDGRKVKEGKSKNIIEEYLAYMVHDTFLIESVESKNDMVAGSDAEKLYSLVKLAPDVCMTGEGGVSIEGVGLFDESGHLLTILNGPKKVKILFRIFVKVALAIPFFAFQVINSKGIRVLGSNTLVQNMKIKSLTANQTVDASFDFDFPELENGEYLIAVGVGDGTANDHIRQAFASDAYPFYVASNSLYQSQAVLLKMPNCKAEVKIM